MVTMLTDAFATPSARRLPRPSLVRKILAVVTARPGITWAELLCAVPGSRGRGRINVLFLDAFKIRRNACTTEFGFAIEALTRAEMLDMDSSALRFWIPGARPVRRR